MNTMTRKILLLLLLTTALSSCTKTATNTKSSTSSGSSPSTSTVTIPPTTSTPPTTSVTGCDGLYRSGATSCYYSNLPKLTFSGLPNKLTYGTTIYSSATDLPSSISPSQFRTDATFSVRIKPTYSNGGEISKQGRTCGPFLTTNFSKLKISVMLRRSVDSIGEVKELTANVDAFSSTARFTVPGGTTDPYVLEVIGLASNHRCNASIYGALSTTQTAACTAGTLYLDIPLRLPTTTVPNPVTECVSFTIQMATDSTYDLPN
jgi:hypothetical protein